MKQQQQQPPLQSPQQSQQPAVTPVGGIHHPDDVRRLKEMQLSLDRITLEKHQDKEAGIKAAAIASEALRAARESESKLKILTQVIEF